MTLHLCRHAPIDGAIIGSLAVDGVFQCYTLEGVATEIPAGTYPIGMHDSPHFGRVLPELLNVPGRSCILLHQGNTDVDTHGCILVGRTRGSAIVYDSKLAFDDLFARLQSATAPITITIEDPAASPQAA